MRETGSSSLPPPLSRHRHGGMTSPAPDGHGTAPPVVRWQLHSPHPEQPATSDLQNNSEI
nr:hypothetical protein Itr_chr09CG01130 [Ipomoea trifida]